MDRLVGSLSGLGKSGDLNSQDFATRPDGSVSADFSPVLEEKSLCAVYVNWMQFTDVWRAEVTYLNEDLHVGISESLLFKGFSCPFEKLDESFLAALGVQFATAALEVFLEQFSADLKPYGGVIESLEEIISSKPEFDVVWSPAIGTCLRAVKLRSPTMARRAAAEVLLQASTQGLKGNWQIELVKPSIFLWESWLLPKCDYLQVSTTGDTASVLIKVGALGENSILFRRNHHNGLKWSSENVQALPSISTHHGHVVLLHEGTFEPSDLGSFSKSFPLVSQITPRNFQSLEKAFELLQEIGPLYYSWVSKIIRRVAVAESGEEKLLKSGSAPGACGFAYISDCDDPLSQAEMLVHEASHNYFYLLTSLGSPVDQSNEELYYSPFVNTMRPLERILFSYHAFANVYIFYRVCQQMLSSYGETCKHRMSETRKDLKIIEGFIKDSKQLTPIGNALMEPLLRYMHDEN